LKAGLIASSPEMDRHEISVMEWEELKILRMEAIGNEPLFFLQ
jgi:hypothetical protein